MRLLNIMNLEVKHICVKYNDKSIFSAEEFGSVDYLGRTI